MAGDWIKMRVALPTDTKVLEMASMLADDRSFMSWLTDPVQCACKQSALEHVTSDVIASLVVTGLLRVWGLVRDRGKQKGDDALLQTCGSWHLDKVSQIPGFGEAMMHVGWAEIDENSGGTIFPNFFKENGLAEEETRGGSPLTAAQRQKRYRDRKGRLIVGDESNESRNAPVTQKSPREEKRREEKIEEPIHTHSEAENTSIGEPIHQKVSKRIFDLYPRRIGPDAAMPEIEAAIRRIQAERGSDVQRACVWLESRVRAFARAPCCVRGPAQFIPQPARWFKEGRYNDDEAAWAYEPQNGHQQEETSYERMKREGFFTEPQP